MVVQLLEARAIWHPEPAKLETARDRPDKKLETPRTIGRRGREPPPDRALKQRMPAFISFLENTAPKFGRAGRPRAWAKTSLLCCGPAVAAKGECDGQRGLLRILLRERGGAGLCSGVKKAGTLSLACPKQDKESLDDKLQHPESRYPRRLGELCRAPPHHRKRITKLGKEGNVEGLVKEAR